MKRATTTEADSLKAMKLTKTGKDSSKPKKPSTPLFVFTGNFRKRYKPKGLPVVSVEIAKAGGEQWKSLTDEEKAPLVATAEKRKEKDELQMLAYDAKLVRRPYKLSKLAEQGADGALNTLSIFPAVSLLFSFLFAVSL